MSTPSRVRSPCRNGDPKSSTLGLVACRSIGPVPGLYGDLPWAFWPVVCTPSLSSVLVCTYAYTSRHELLFG